MGTLPMTAPAAARIAFKNILFATDFSPASKAALPFAIAVAKREGGTLFIAHVLPREPRPPISMEPRASELNVVRLHAQQHFEQLERSALLRDVAHEPILRHGSLCEVLGEVMASRRIDLVVIGTHGRTGFRKLVLGCMAEKIFRSATCPVLTVGPHVSASLLRDGRFHHVLFATDFSAGSLHALPYAVSLARADFARLTLLHVMHMTMPVPVEFGSPLLDSEEQMGAESRRRLTELMRQAGPEYEAEIVVRSGVAAGTIVDTAEQRDAGIIVMGVHGAWTPVASHNPWTIADGVVCRAHCPVLTVR